MRRLLPLMIGTMALVACAGGQRVGSSTVASKAESTPGAAPAAAAAPTAPGAGPGTNEFVLGRSAPASNPPDAKPSKITPTRTEAAMRFVAIDKDKGPIQGVVISLTAPDGTKYYTEETDAEGNAEVLVPVGRKYEIVYLSLGRRDIAASVTVTDEPKQNVKLTLRYKRPPPAPPTPSAPEPAAARFVLHGVTFDTGKAGIRPESFPRLDSIVEFMTHKKSTRIEISGHSDNVGNPKANKALSEKRAKACRDYLISKGIDGSRVAAIGYGDERPIAPNDSEDGRQKNRRIEATEL